MHVPCFAERSLVITQITFFFFSPFCWCGPLRCCRLLHTGRRHKVWAEGSWGFQLLPRRLWWDELIFAHFLTLFSLHVDMASIPSPLLECRPWATKFCLCQNLIYFFNLNKMLHSTLELGITERLSKYNPEYKSLVVNRLDTDLSSVMHPKKREPDSKVGLNVKPICCH